MDPTALPKLDRISIVLATWCPHCVPLSLEMSKKMSAELGIPLRVLDIDDPEKCRVADRLVREFGDDCEDYLIPQVFAEFSDGSVKHLLTGFSENPDITKRHWNDFFQSRYYEQLKASLA